jgi:magnesium transporter
VKANSKPKSAAILGLAFDNDDGHTRLTRGKNFVLLGGSQDTHTVMQETADKVNELLNRHEISLNSLATSFCLALPGTALVSDALTRFRDRRRRYDVVTHVYVVNEEGVLKGVVDIRELIQADPAATLGSIMTQQVVTLSLHDSLAIAAREFGKYGFVALPLLDDAGKLVGAVRYRDLLAVKD